MTALGGNITFSVSGDTVGAMYKAAYKELSRILDPEPGKTVQDLIESVYLDITNEVVLTTFGGEVVSRHYEAEVTAILIKQRL